MRKFIFLISAFITIIVGCTERKYVTSGDVVLDFSVDTVYFDTVFTSIGTSTRELRVVNSNKRCISIDQISLASANSSFRLNIDGITGDLRNNIDIAPGDSIYSFGGYYEAKSLYVYKRVSVCIFGINVDAWCGVQ